MNARDSALLGEIEPPLPLRAQAGRVLIRGWCLDASGAAPAMRASGANTLLTVFRRLARPDVVSQARLPRADANCGFEIEGEFPPGVHAVKIEALLAEGGWTTLRELTLAVDPVPFTAVIEGPLRSGTLRESRRLAGWAAHPRMPIAALSLRYGHRDAPCDYGQPRADVAGLFPTTTHLAAPGFETAENLPAGRGPLRVRARLTDGRFVVARPPLEIDITQDENGGTAPTPGVELASLPRGSPPPPVPSALATRARNVLFILHGSFDSNSALHATALANELAAMGHACALAVPRDLETLAQHAGARFRGLLHADAESHRFPDGRGPDIIHAWTTRELVRRVAAGVLARHAAKLIVHLEDNEAQLLAATTGRSAAELAVLSEMELEKLVTPGLSHPVRSQEFLAAADGVTVIVDSLRQFVPAGKPCLTWWPAADERYFFPRPKPLQFRAKLDLQPDELVLFYHGNVHAANASEVRELYAAVTRLNETGCPVTLIRAGLDAVDFLGPWAARVHPHVLSLGRILQHRHLAPLLALADIFVQPGEAGAFNDYRFPSKLPEFFSVGRPVVLPRANLGEHVRHGIDAWVLSRADAAGIVAAVHELKADPELRARLSQGAVAFARENFSWRRSATALANFHATLTASD